jgi:hypothetical protein
MGLLVHLRKSLTPHSPTTLEIRLCLSEEDRSLSECVFLEDPAPLAQRAVQDVLLNKSHVLTFAPDITLPLSKLTATMLGNQA